MNKQVNVELGSRSYPIHIDSENFSLDQIKQSLNVKNIVIFTNETVDPLYSSLIIKELNQLSNARILKYSWPDGEQFKNQAHWSQALDFLAEHQIHRSDILISLGGGVVCDMTGFVASCWMRGVRFIQIPTTLLAQIDASVGGKTAINHSKGKNLIGAFHQPLAVLINSSSLKTLKRREFAAGIGEAIKYGYINQPAFLSWLHENHKKINNLDPQCIRYLIMKCCQFKAEIVSQDEKEQGQRALLNFGHTFGHAIETLTGYKTYLHGEAVALGMLMALETSALLKMCSVSAKQELIQLLNLFDLPAKVIANVTAKDIVDCIRLDKKSTNNQHNLILYDEKSQQAKIVNNVLEDIIFQAVSNCL